MGSGEHRSTVYFSRILSRRGRPESTTEPATRRVCALARGQVWNPVREENCDEEVDWPWLRVAADRRTELGRSPSPHSENLRRRHQRQHVCDLKHMMPGGAKACTEECVKNGSKYALADQTHQEGVPVERSGQGQELRRGQGQSDRHSERRHDRGQLDQGRKVARIRGI